MLFNPDVYVWRVGWGKLQYDYEKEFIVCETQIFFKKIDKLLWA